MRRIVTRTLITVAIASLLIVWALGSRSFGRAGATGFLGPLLRAWHAVDGLVDGGMAWLVPWRRGPGSRARDLEAQLRLAELRLAETADIHRQWVQLRELVDLPPPPGWRVIIAEVIARDPITWNRGFRVARGRAHGIEPGCAVLAGSSVIGRVTECQERSATVTTVGSQACRLAVVLENSRQTGILRGTGTQKWRSPPECVVDFLPKEIDVTAGEAVYTSGLGGTVPRGLLVGRTTVDSSGRITEIVKGAHAKTNVQPTAPFNRIRFVAIITHQQSVTPSPDADAETSNGTDTQE